MFFFLDRQFRGDVAILVFLKTMVSYNPTSLTPLLFIEVHVLSHESEWSCICVLGISNCPISTIFYWIFGTFPTMWYFFFIFIIGCEKRIEVMNLQQGLHERFCKLEQKCSRVWEQTETSLKSVDLSWMYQKIMKRSK